MGFMSRFSEGDNPTSVFDLGIGRLWYRRADRTFHESKAPSQTSCGIGANVGVIYWAVMTLWNASYTKKWLQCQHFHPDMIFADTVDGKKLALLDQLSFEDFKHEFLAKPESAISKTEWIRLKHLTKSLDSDEVNWPRIVREVSDIAFEDDTEDADSSGMADYVLDRAHTRTDEEDRYI